MTTVRLRLKVPIASVRLAIFVCISVVLSSCSLAPAIQNNSLEYDNVIEDVSNSALMTNILRGRDDAPLYFPDIAIVRGSIAASASTQASLPYGPTFGTVQAGPFSASSNPSFDIAPSNTKKFYQGLLNPISQPTLAYYVERNRGSANLAPVFYMMVAAIDVFRDGHLIATHTSGSAKFIELSQKWLSRYPIILTTKGKSKGALDVRADAKAIVDATAAGYDVTPIANGLVRLEKKKASNPVICFPMDGGYIAIGVNENSTVKAPGGDDIDLTDMSANEACAGLGRPKHATGLQYKLHLRSVEQIFNFLGREIDPEVNDLLFPDGPFAGCKILPFFVNSVSVDHTRFTVRYRGTTYYIADATREVPCGSTMVVDSTMPILAILNDLLNLNRDADEVPTTKAVTAVGRS